jgi:hypothetical protein
MTYLTRNSMLLGLAFLSAFTGSVRAICQQTLEIDLKPAKTTVLLGEPLWVDVSVTNRSQEAQYVDFGVACFGVNPLNATLPGAERVVPEIRPCGSGVAGSCSSGPPPILAPGDTLTRRYVVKGDFRIGHAGIYDALLEKRIRYWPALDVPTSSHQPVSQEQIQRLDFQLNVLPSDPGATLHLEQEVARTIAEQVPPPTPVASTFNQPIDRAKWQAMSRQRQNIQFSNLLIRYANAEGLAEYPVAGMEPFFLQWIEVGTFDTYGLQALKRLNTKAARDTLAELAGSTLKPSDTRYQGDRAQAVDALSVLGDTSFVPLIERLTNDENRGVQRSAVSELGNLGGEMEVPLLERLARNGVAMSDRSEAIMALGDTRTLRAVPLLIELATLPDSDEPSASYYALRRLTHLEFPNPHGYRGSEIKSVWLDFWQKHKQGARTYGRYECSDALTAKTSPDSEIQFSLEAAAKTEALPTVQRAPTATVQMDREQAISQYSVSARLWPTASLGIQTIQDVVLDVEVKNDSAEGAKDGYIPSDLFGYVQVRAGDAPEPLSCRMAEAKDLASAGTASWPIGARAVTMFSLKDLVCKESANNVSAYHIRFCANEDAFKLPGKVCSSWVDAMVDPAGDGGLRHSKTRLASQFQLFRDHQRAADLQPAFEALEARSFVSDPKDRIAGSPTDRELMTQWLNFYSALDSVEAKLKNQKFPSTCVSPPTEGVPSEYMCDVSPAEIKDPVLRQKYEAAISENEERVVAYRNYSDVVHIRSAAFSPFWMFLTGLYRGDEATQAAIVKEALALGCSPARAEWIRAVISAPQGTFAPKEPSPVATTQTSKVAK